jgi:CHAT domain-containing protein
MMTWHRRRTIQFGGVLLACLAGGIAPSNAQGASGPPANAVPGFQLDDKTKSWDRLKEFQQLLKDGILNNSLGRHQNAEKSFRLALGFCLSRFGPKSSNCGDVSLRLALEISNQERFDEAELQFKRTEEIARASQSPLDLPKFLTYRAMDAANRHEFDTAMRFVTDANQKRKALLKTAFENARMAEPDAKQRLDSNLSDLAHGLYVQASIAFHLGRIAEAKVTAYLVRNLISKAKSIPDWWIAFADALLADIELREGNIDAAEKRLRLALKAKQVALGNTRAVALSHMALGAVFRRANRNTAALEISRPGLSILRGELRQAPGISVDRLEPFLQASYAMAQRDPARRAALYAEMFTATQLARTSRTAQTVAKMAARFATKNPDITELVQSLQYQTQLRDELRITLGRAIIAAAGGGSSKELASLKKAYTRAAHSVAGLEKKLKKVFPSYSDLVSPAPASADAVSAVLKPEEALVYFVSGARGGFVFVVRPTGVKAAAFDLKRAELGKLIRQLRIPFEKRGSRIAPYDLELGHRLYRKLLGPVEGALTGVRHLIVVSSNELLSLPFSMLVTEPPNDGADRYQKAAWLVRKHAVTQMPSIRSFTSFRRTVQGSTAPLPFIGFGNPAFSGKSKGAGLSALSEHCQLGAPVPASLVRGLAALPETEDELKRVAKALGAKRNSIILGNDVTEARVRDLPLDQYKVVYFATHGLLPGELRCQSQPALALSPPVGSVQDRGADGLLEASEIAALKLNANLVVLSACNTGGGGSGKLGGESLSGLARAFFQAGTRSILVSHWQVDTVATARLMTRIFEHLSSVNQQHIAEALQRSQIDMLKTRDTAHPYFWSAFTLVGEGRLGNKLASAEHPKQIGQRP